MSLSRKIADALDARTDTDPMPADLTVADGPTRLTLSLTAVAPLGIAFSRLEFSTRAFETWTPQGLKSWGDRVARRVTYLMEPLVVLEVDAEAGQVALRSQSPTAREERKSFYEIRLHREGSLTLQRIAFDAATRRRSTVPCQLTREVIERLTDDLVASVG